MLSSLRKLRTESGLGVTPLLLSALCSLYFWMAWLLLDTPTTKGPAVSAWRGSVNDPSFIDLFGKRWEMYLSLRTESISLIFLSGVLIVFSLAVHRTQKEKFEIPLIGDVQRGTIHAVLPFAIVSVWTRWGYVLHSLIENRVAIWDLTKAHQEPMQGQYGSLLRGGFFGDQWFYSYMSDYMIVKRSVIADAGNLMVMIGFAIFFAAMHASAMALPIYYKNRTADVSKELSVFLWSVFSIVAFAFVLSHAQFYFAGQHPSWFNGVCWGCVVLWLGIYEWIDRYKRKNINDS